MGQLLKLYGGGFSPMQYAPALWLDASDQSTLYQDRTGASATTLVASDADPVGTWRDKSGNGKHFTASSDAVRPTYKVAIQNGKTIVRMDGTDDFLSSSVSIANVRTVVLVLKYRNSTYLVGYPGIFTPTVSSVESITGTASGTSIHPVVPASTYYRNGIQTIQTASGSGPMNEFTVCIFIVDSASWSTNPFQIGKDRTNPGRFSHMDYSELLLYTSELSTSQRQQVERYLANKWGITLS